ncbi:MAG: hypothetical protein ACRDQA_14425 [Nocardioidaceae bacterium]
MEHPSDTEDQARPQAEDYKHLPEPVRLEETIATKESDPPPDPEMGRNTDREFMLRYAAPG